MVNPLVWLTRRLFALWDLFGFLIDTDEIGDDQVSVVLKRHLCLVALPVVQDFQTAHSHLPTFEVV